jgi:hypothetical protein
VDEAEIERLCEELGAFIELEPGVNPVALSRARTTIGTLHLTRSGSCVNQKLVGLAYGFEQWFSPGKWNRHDDHGEFVKHHLEDDLVGLRAAMWIKSRGDRAS